MHSRKVFGSPDLRLGASKDSDYVSLLLEPGRNDVFHILHQAHHTYCRCRVDRDAFRFVKEADVAPCDRDTQRPTSSGHPFNCFLELPHYLRIFRVPEVETVCNSKRDRTASNQVSGCLGYSMGCALPRIEAAVKRVDLRCHSQPLACPRDTDDLGSWATYKIICVLCVLIG